MPRWILPALITLILPGLLPGQVNLSARLENTSELLLPKERYLTESLNHGEGGNFVQTTSLKLVLVVAGRFDIGVGFGYHARPVMVDCLFWPGPDDPVAQVGPGPVIEPDQPCTHRAEGKVRFYEAPLFFGYGLINREQFRLSAGLQANLWSRKTTEIDYMPVGSRPEFATRSAGASRNPWKYHGIWLNAEREVFNRGRLLLGLAFRADDFSYRRTRVGLNLGLQYLLLKGRS